MLESATFWASKIVSMRGDSIDAFQLAQLLFMDAQISTACNVLSRHELDRFSRWGKLLKAQALIKQGKWDDALVTLGDFQQPDRICINAGPAWIAFDRSLDASHGQNIKIDASIWHTRGVACMNQSRLDDARMCFMNAIQADPRCIQAFQIMISNHLIRRGDKSLILTWLNASTLSQQEREIISVMYHVLLAQVSSDISAHDFTSQHAARIDQLKLTYDTDVLLAQAQLHSVKADIDRTLAITSQILESDPLNMTSLPLHIVSLYDQRDIPKLFDLSHKLVDSIPNSHMSWFAIGVYYLATEQYGLARDSLRRTTSMAPNFAQGWIAFGHSYALDNEHDHAIQVYSTALRHSPHQHTAHMYLGIEYLHSHDLMLAETHLAAAYRLCEFDPMLFCELGVLKYRQRRYRDAIEWFDRVIKVVGEFKTAWRAWNSVLVNMGHAYRKLG
eukprot:jgi/Hompol1/5183/HPOL_001917-RA